MALRLRRRERAATGVHRLLLTQVQRIGACVTAAPLTAQHVHEARQRLKRLRALLRLLRGQLPTELSTRGHGLCRTLAQSLASSRDATVLAQTLDRLRQGPEAAAIDFAIWQARLSGGSGGDETAPHASLAALNSLRQWAEEVLRWPLGAGGWALFAPGLTHTYRAGRRAFRQARALGRDEDFHDWRKRVKDRWYQLALLRRMGQPKLGEHLARLRGLAKQLGREHDLTMLIERLAQLGDGPESVASLVRLAQRARRPLRRRALRAGRRLYADGPRRDLNRLHQFWRGWRSGRD